MKNNDPNIEKAWVLGASYNNAKNTPCIEFHSHAESFFRFTYRRDFPSFDPYPITSDAGWGCMLRAAQMMMGYGFRRHFLGSDWRIPKNKESLRNTLDYCDILQWFVDYPGYPHIYSIHHMVQCGMKYDKLPGEWFGPSTAALVLRDLAKLHRSKYSGPLEVLVTQGDTLYITEAEKLCCDTSATSKNISQLARSGESNILLNDDFCRAVAQQHYNCNKSTNSNTFDPLSDHATSSNLPKTASKPSSVTGSTKSVTKGTAGEVRVGDSFFDPLLHQPPALVAPWAHSLIVMMPLRLGIDTVNEEYIEEIKEVLRNKNCIGILGGRPNRAIYFVGYNSNNELLGLDPHTVFTTPDISSNTHNAATNTAHTNIFPNAEYLNQIHVNDFVRLGFNNLDPSLALGFYFENRDSFAAFCEEIRVNNAKKTAKGLHPMFNVQHSPPSFMLDDSESDEDGSDDSENETEEGDVSDGDKQLRKQQQKSQQKNKNSTRRDGFEFDDEITGTGGSGANGDIEDEYVFL